jgi:hypothetical protein
MSTTTTNPAAIIPIDLNIPLQDLVNRAVHLFQRQGLRVRISLYEGNELWTSTEWIGWDPSEGFSLEIDSSMARLLLENVSWIYSMIEKVRTLGRFHSKELCRLRPHRPVQADVLTAQRLRKNIKEVFSEFPIRAEEDLKDYMPVISTSSSFSAGFAWSFGQRNQLPSNDLKSVPPSALNALACSAGEFIRPVYYDLVKERVLTRRRHVQVMGPPGIGKSFFIEHLAQEEEKPLFNLNCDGKIGRSHIEGTREITKGTSFFKNSGFAEAVINGHWAKLDELNMAEPDAIVSLNGIIAPPFKINLDNKQYDVHPDFRLFVTYNPGLTGTKSLPESLEDRLFPIVATHPDPVTCGKILVSNGLTPEVSLRLTMFANTVWAFYREKKLRYALSIRRLLDAGEMLMDGYGWEESLRTSLLSLVKLPSDCSVLEDVIKSS